MIQQKEQEDLLDLALAAELQSALLPRQCPTDCPHQVASARNRMCGSVGGDFYDFIRLNPEQYVILIGDVVGHGIRAALLMAQIMGYLRSRPSDLSRPSLAVAALNRMLIELGDRTDSVTPCSMLYGVIDAPSGIGFFINAGHPAPLLCDGEQCFSVGSQANNILLGVEPFEAEETCLTFHPGHRLILYTDGLIEATNPQHEQFTRDRLLEVICENTDKDTEACSEAVFRAVEEFRAGTPQTDDQTIVVIDRI